jgi:hypothetical protein
LTITSYADLLAAAMKQAEPQRLLFVFAEAELPGGRTDAEKQRFHAGAGGALSPVMCVDKLPGELSSFESLVEESRQTGKNWDIVFVSSLSGRSGIAPGSDEAVASLELMIQAVKNGAIGNFLVFNRNGDLIQLRRRD